MIAIYILAVIGGICLIGVAGLLFAFSWAEHFSEDEESKGETHTCALTGKHCITDNGRPSCEGCPVLEEAEKSGNRQNG